MGHVCQDISRQPVTKRQSLGSTKFKAFTVDKFNVAKLMKKKPPRKRRKCSLPAAFFIYPSVFL